MTFSEELHNHLHYEPSTGVWTWLVPTTNTVKKGDVAATVANEHGHLEIRFRGRRYRLHRLAWFYVTGEWPVERLDHINGDPADNRFANLRQATQSQNCANSRRGKNNTSGVKGVHWDGVNKRWRAAIMFNRKQISIGRFDTIEEAAEAYMEKAVSLFGEFARAA